MVKEPQITHHFYCDEAGNDGNNFGPSAQKIHVFAGWLVPDTVSTEFRSIASELTSSARAEELKASRLLRRESGQRRILSLFQRLPHGVLPFFLIAERRYGLAVKVNHTLFDAGHNEQVTFAQVLGDNERPVAERLLKLPTQILNEFAGVYSKPDKGILGGVIRNLSHAARQIGDIELSNWFSGATDAIDEIWDSDFTDNDHLKHYERSCMNTPIFLQVVRLVDAFLEIHHKKNGRAGLLRIIHDETPQFSSAFRYYAESFLNDRQRDITLRDFNNIRFFIRYLSGFETQESKGSPELRAADFLASSLFRLARDALDGIAWSAPMTNIAALTVPAIMLEAPFNGGVFGTEDLMFRLIMGCTGKFFPPRTE